MQSLKELCMVGPISEEALHRHILRRFCLAGSRDASFLALCSFSAFDTLKGFYRGNMGTIRVPLKGSIGGF